MKNSMENRRIRRARRLYVRFGGMPCVARLMHFNRQQSRRWMKRLIRATRHEEAERWDGLG